MMAMITDETIERVREAADIVQIIGEHVSLKRSGADFRGPCPFHQGTHRNFSVSGKKGIYYCFVCHEGGDVFTFLQKRLAMDWPSAVRYVAERAGVEVLEVETRRVEADPRQPFWEINAAAADFFRRMLWDEDTGRQARDYLALRRVSREVSDTFGLGFAPRDASALRSHLNALGYDDSTLLESGLLVRREEESDPRVRFRGRLIFPILDAGGNHVGFGGRLLGPGEPKYLNSAESPVFSKSRLLYGLNWAKHSIRRDGRALLVEGYFDVVRLVSAGIQTVVAPLGTALTEAQAGLLARYTRSVFLLYDSDRAGLKATFRAGDELLRHGVSVQVVTLPDGEDPDTFVDRMGREKLEEVIDKSIDVFERKVQLLERAGWFADLRRKRRALDRLLPTIRAASDALTRDIYLSRAAETAAVSKELLARELGELGEARASAASAPPVASQPEEVAKRRGRDRTARARRRGGRGESAERELVRVMVHRRAQVDALRERVHADDFRHRALREIFEALLRVETDVSIQKLAAALSPEAVSELQGLLEEPDSVVDLQRTVEDSLAVLRVRDVKTRMAEIDRLTPLATGAEKDSLIMEKTRLGREIRALGKNGEGGSGKREAATGGRRPEQEGIRT